ncbi:LuxR C-terminal-related transcriptional regulator [Clostridium sp. YIM B02569]|uniref:helix-turn-helix transcriptional regulator n=1 Tax=Clostridium sp. YIM B02569 TaxID=2911967 RepID=UPI001EED36A9|nr:LuxR C-terminal-related transcriptional regulator [Clostridium sp. YIM B02569]
MKNEIFRPKLLYRKRINKLLQEIFRIPIYFISASMGYGKSIAVRNFIEKNKRVQTIWLDITNDEIDDMWIWKKFCDLIKNINFKLGEMLYAYGVPNNNKDVYKIIDIIRNEIRQETIIIIDDWDDEKIVYINHLIKAIILEDISNLHIVIISRKKPANEYIEFELKQKCMIMRQEDIAFTFDETIEFFKINGIMLTEAEEKELYEYTGGWTSAMYLALIQYYSQNTFDDIPKATELIKIAVYDKFDEVTKQILLKLAFVENFTIEQAMYITEDERSKEVIRRVCSNNCFIRYDKKEKIYRLHSILKNALEEELALSNVDLMEVNNICGDWYAKNFNDIYAMEYYYKAKNYERILDLIERNYTIDLTNLYKEIIKPVFNELTISEKIKRPIAYLTYLFFYILYGNRIAGAKLLYEAKAIYIEDKNLKDKNQILGEIAFLESILVFYNVRRMIECHKKAYELFKGGGSRIANNKMPATFGSPHFLYLFHRKVGNLKELVEFFQQGINYFIHISNGGAAGANYLMMAEYFYETGDSKNGELFAYKAFHKAKTKKQTSIIICSLFLLTRICVNKNYKNEVKNNFYNLIKEYENLNIPIFLNGSQIAIGYIDGITGNLENLNKWIKNIENHELKNIMPVIGMNHVITGLAMILKGSYIELEIQVEIMLEVYTGKKSIFGIVYAYIFDSIAKYKLYGKEIAKKSLVKAIELAEKDHIVMCFVELAPHILPLLESIKNESAYVKCLIPKCKEYNQIYLKRYCNLEKIELTPREIEIMKLVYHGYKQSEISDKLNIALVTVKKHIASVYCKLNVRNKTIAINQLKEKGII